MFQNPDGSPGPDGKKSQIASLSTFDQRELKKINYFDKIVSRVRERVKNSLSRTLDTFL